MKIRMLALVIICVEIPALAAGASFGKLPAGAISTNVVKDVHAEICRDHLFSPSLVDAKYSGYAVGSLCFMSVGSFDVDGEPVQSPGPIPMAFWWVHAAGPRDLRMQGEVDWLQLASWYSRDVSHREKVLAADPMAQFVDLEVTEAEPNLWRVRIALPDESLEAEVRGSGQRIKRNAPEPSFMSVPFTGRSAGSFWVISYFGHHHQSAQGQWRARGSGVFSDALQIPGEASVFETVLQDGWSALSGLYTP
jgi:hypothetical protein